MKPLLLRPMLVPGESLLSWCVRTSKVNRYDSPGTLFALCADALDCHVDDLPRDMWLQPDATLISAFKSVTGLSSEQINAATAHRFDQALLPGAAPKELKKLCFNLRPDAPARFCPQCLRQGAYHRVLWLAKANLACIEHACWMLDACPNCHVPARVLDIIRDRCGDCDSRLSANVTAGRQRASETVLHTQQLVLDWLAGQAADTSSNQAGLPHKSNDVLYALADGLRLSILIQREAARELAPRQVEAAQWSGAIDAMKDWPTRFIALLHRHRAEPLPYCGLGQLYKRGIRMRWRHNGLAFVQDAFTEFLRQTYRFEPVRVRHLPHLKRDPGWFECCDVIFADEAAEQLRLTPRDLRGLIKACRLRYLSMPTPCHGRAQMFVAPHALRREDVAGLLGGLPELPTSDDCSRFLGCSEELIEDMLQAGLLSGLRCTALLELTVQFGQHKGSSTGDLCLRHAIDLLATVGIDAVTLFQSIVSRQISFELPRIGCVFDLRRPCLSNKEIQDWVNSVMQQQNWMEERQATAHLEVSENALSMWICAGILSPQATYGENRYFDRDEINGLRGQVLSGQCFLTWLSIPAWVLSVWVDVGWITPICEHQSRSAQHAFFRRCDLEQLRARIAATQICLQNFGLNKTQIKDWLWHARVNLLENDTTPIDWLALTNTPRMAQSSGR